MPDRELIDRSLKALMERALPDLARYLGLAIDPARLRPADTAASIPELRADSLFLDDQDDHSIGVQVEYLLYPDRRELRKLFARSAAINYKLPQRVPLVVLYLLRGRWRRPPHCLDLSEGRLVTRFEFTTLCLWELKDEIRSGSLRRLAPLLVLCEDSPDEALLREEMGLIASLEVPERTRADLIGIALAVAGRKYRPEQLLRVFEKEVGMLKQMGVVEAWIAEGEARGEARGEMEEARRMVRRVVEGRWGALPETLELRIASASREECETLILRAAIAQSVQELAE